MKTISIIGILLFPFLLFAQMDLNVIPVHRDSLDADVITQNGFTILGADSGDRVLATYDTNSYFIGEQTDLPNCVEITYDGNVTVPGDIFGQIHTLTAFSSADRQKNGYGATILPAVVKDGIIVGYGYSYRGSTCLAPDSFGLQVYVNDGIIDTVGYFDTPGDASKHGGYQVGLNTPVSQGDYLWFIVRTPNDSIGYPSITFEIKTTE